MVTKVMGWYDGHEDPATILLQCNDDGTCEVTLSNGVDLCIPVCETIEEAITEVYNCFDQLRKEGRMTWNDDFLGECINADISIYRV